MNRSSGKCFPQRFLVIRDADSFMKLKLVTRSGVELGCGDESVGEWDDFAKQMKLVSIFADKVGAEERQPNQGFWQTGTKSAFKTMCITAYSEQDTEMDMP